MDGDELLQHPRWTDMPDFESFETVAEIQLVDSTMVQVAHVRYKGLSGVSVTGGNLFGSQTIMTPGYKSAMYALSLMSSMALMREHNRSDNNERFKLSAQKYGWTLLPNKGTKNDDQKESGAKEGCCANQACECEGSCACNEG